MDDGETGPLETARGRVPPLTLLGATPVRAVLPVAGVVLLAGAAAEATATSPLPLFNGVSVLLRRAGDGVALRVPPPTAVLVPVVVGLTYGVVSVLVAQRYLGTQPQRRVALRVVGARWLPLVSLSLLRAAVGASLVAAVTVAVGGGLGWMLGSALAFAISLVTWLAEPAVVLERRGVLDALRRSIDQVRGGLLVAATALVLAGVLSVAIGLLLGLPFLALRAGFEASNPGLGRLAEVVAFGLPPALTAVVASTAGALLHLDRRVEREGLNGADLAADVEP